ncbi:oligopeptide/dipeptide ABC transporter ATP-binding protein, partial [Vibrio zhanjiangensis]|uniref:oligopeptide/dipeptide ABC transporter ATP-binding protein n=1 Tax=Vibrio zhanjiangensis TaxID=1046128 RepID=UPI0032AFDAC2
HKLDQPLKELVYVSNHWGPLLLERSKQIEMLEGDLPSPINPPSGCVFRTRCPQATQACAETKPSIKGNDIHAVSCLLESV